MLANRLSADRNNQVLLLEAGPVDNSLFISMPTAFIYAATDQRFDWGYYGEKEPYISDRLIHCPRGRVTGGSSSINSMSFVRGHRRDFDRWATESGYDEWSYAQCLPYFKKLENFSKGENEFRGAGGPVNVLSPLFSNPLCDVFLKACEQIGHPISKDTNGRNQEGFAEMEQTIRNGQRESAASAYLHPISSRPNLTILNHAHTNRIGLTRQTNNTQVAQEVEVSYNGEIVFFKAHQEIILSAGAINTPQILMLSGIGPAQHLKSMNIKVLRDLPGVGENLQDHAEVSLQYESRQPITTTPYLKPWRKAMLGIQWLFTKQGLGATNHFEVAGYVNSRDDVEHPDLQIVFIPLLVRRDGKAYNDTHGFQTTISLLRPKSKGQIRLKEKDPNVAPSILFNYLKETQDLVDLKSGIAKSRAIFSAPAFQDFLGSECEPGTDAVSDEALETYIRQTMGSTKHPSCTCKMGKDELSVVDGSGRVNGVQRLRIVDASIMPSITSGNINAPVLMLAEKISADILRSNNQEI